MRYLEITDVIAAVRKVLMNECGTLHHKTEVFKLDRLNATRHAIAKNAT